MSASLVVAGVVAAAWGAFVLWYGGRGRPLSADEVDTFRRLLRERATSSESRALVDAIEGFTAGDDGREFVMQNLARYRERAAYPPGSGFGDDPRAADRRYARAIMPQLLRRASLPIFVARRCGRFAEPDGARPWHYVALVRYRSRRDFLRFALAIERDDIVMHKWAALEETHIFPVAPLVSLVTVRAAVGAVLALAGLLAGWAIG